MQLPAGELAELFQRPGGFDGEEQLAELFGNSGRHSTRFSVLVELFQSFVAKADKLHGASRIHHVRYHRTCQVRNRCLRRGELGFVVSHPSGKTKTPRGWGIRLLRIQSIREQKRPVEVHRLPRLKIEMWGTRHLGHPPLGRRRQAKLGFHRNRGLRREIHPLGRADGLQLVPCFGLMSDAVHEAGSRVREFR